MELDPLARHVLPDELGPVEGHALARGQQRPEVPPLAVALERQPQGVQARRGELPARRDPVDDAEHPGHVDPPAPAEGLDGRLEVVVGGAAGQVGRRVDLALVEQAAQLGRDRPRGRAARGHADGAGARGTLPEVRGRRTSVRRDARIRAPVDLARARKNQQFCSVCRAAHHQHQGRDEPGEAHEGHPARW